MPKDKLQNLYLIDAHAQFFRAYHAIRTPMSSPVTKEPTNATFGFVGMLLKLLTNHDPDYIAVAYDASGDRATFRSELYPDYKANRDAPPDDFKPQAERCLNILRALDIPVLGVEGYEADDVIATLAKQIGEDTPNVKVRIVSKDKDLQQLLAESTTTNGNPTGGVDMFDVHTEAEINTKTLYNDKGITPNQVVDMLALMGDTSDNVPGVPGIGPKTAAQLIAEFRTLDAIIEEATADKPKTDWKIKGKRRENIAAAAETLPLSKQLVTLIDDVPLEFSMDDAAVSSFNLPALLPILKELGFNRYQDELRSLVGSDALEDANTTTAPSSAPEGFLFDTNHANNKDQPAKNPKPADADYTVITKKADLEKLAKDLAKRTKPFAIDTETTDLKARRAQLVGISISTDPGTGVYIPTQSPDNRKHLNTDTTLDILRPVLEDPSIPKTGHNLKYDTIVLRNHGVTLRGVIDDTMVTSYLIDSERSSHALDKLALAILNHNCIPIKDLIGSGKNQKRFNEVLLEDAAPYAAEDADIALRLHQTLAKKLTDLGLAPLLHNLELPLIDALAELEYNGITVDPDILEQQRDQLSKQIEQLRNDILDAAPREFNPDSPVQLRTILFNKPSDEEPGLGLPTKGIKKTKTGHSTDAETLQKLADNPDIDSPIPRLIVEHRQLTKLVNTYLAALHDDIDPDTGRIHASFNQTVAATGRLSSSDPNLQNIPIRTDIGRNIRKAFVAPEGTRLVSADYSQIELRILAHLSQDDNLIAAFKEGQDIHRAVAAQINDVPPSKVTNEQRSSAKQVNFGIVYGITPYGLARRIGISSDEAANIIDSYKERFPGITSFLEECIQQARDLGYVSTILGRRRPIPDIEDRNQQRRSLAERTAINTVVQGSAADLIKLAMLDIHQRLRLDTNDQLPDDTPDPIRDNRADIKMLLQIHDELVFEAPEPIANDTAKWIKHRMENAMHLTVPLTVETTTGTNWFEGK